MMKFGRVIPILRMFNEAKMREFYIDFLEFSVDWEHRFEPDLPLFLQISKDECVLYLSEHHGDACPGAAITIDMDDVTAYQQYLLAKKYGYSRPGVEDTEWGTRDMTIGDPFGNKITFSESRSDTGT